MAGDFAAQMTAWALKTEARILAVVQTASQDLANEVRVPKGAGGNMPVDTGNLRRSLMGSTTDVPAVRPGATFGPNDGQITASIAGMELGDTLYLGFQANYAMRMEYGFNGKDSLGRQYNQQGNGFVRTAAQRWSIIVENAARAIEQRVEGS